MPVTPNLTWQTTVTSLVVLLRDGNPLAQKTARQLLERMAFIADNTADLVEASKVLVEHIDAALPHFTSERVLRDIGETKLALAKFNGTRVTP